MVYDSWPFYFLTCVPVVHRGFCDSCSSVNCIESSKSFDCWLPLLTEEPDGCISHRVVVTVGGDVLQLRGWPNHTDSSNPVLPWSTYGTTHTPVHCTYAPPHPLWRAVILMHLNCAETYWCNCCCCCFCTPLNSIATATYLGITTERFSCYGMWLGTYVYNVEEECVLIIYVAEVRCSGHLAYL